MNSKNQPLDRAGRKRAMEKRSGFAERRVTVRSEEDINDLVKLEAEMTLRFARQLLAEAEQQNNQPVLSPDVQRALEHALLLKGSAEYVTVHGAFSTFLTELLENDLTAEVATAVPIYTQCFPSSVDYVLKSMPAKVTNYLCRFANSTAVMGWIKANPDWQAQMTSSLRNGTFAEHLKRLREAIGASDVNYRFLQALGKLCQDAESINAKAQKQARQILKDAPEALYQSPREWNDPCNSLRTFILYYMLVELERRYGEMEFPDRTYPVPFYSRQREVNGMNGSGIVSFWKDQPLAKDYDYGVCIGWRFDRWESCFYQLAHEAVHLLNPRIAPHGELKISALEEGVAVRFAEEMLDKYLPYIGRTTVQSPITGPGPYLAAFEACKALPDEVLRQVRDTFVSFGNIYDRGRFAMLTSSYLTDAQIDLLCADFPYPPQADA